MNSQSKMNYITKIGVVNFKKKKQNEDINDIYEKHINSGQESQNYS